MATTREMAQMVQDHALAHYEQGEWSTVVECYSLADIENELIEHNATTAAEAVELFAAWCDLLGEQRAACY